MGYHSYIEYHAPLAFYVWTDTLILNTVKVRLDWFPELPADLIVLGLPRISRELVNSIERQGIFRRIIWIRPPLDDIPAIKRKFSKIFLGDKYKTNYFTQLKSASEYYAALFTGALWSETILLYQYLRQYNPDIEINVIEEGTVNYYGIKATEKCDPLNKWRDQIVRRTRYSDMYQQAVRAVTRMFLSCPEGCVSEDQEQICRILGHESAEFRLLLSSCVDGAALELYRSRQVIFFLQPEHGSGWGKTLELIQAAVYAVGAENIVVRPHPDNIDLAQQLKEFLGPDVYVETAQFPFEYVLYTIKWENQVLISRGSSCLFHPRYILGEEPTVVFTNQLYGDAINRSDTVSILAERLKRLYQVPERVFWPETIEDFRNSLRRILS